jgi:hypothetical protein
MIAGRRPADTYPAIVEHMKRVRRVPGCGTATIVVIPESNLGFEASNIAGHLALEFGLEGPGNYVIMREDDLRAGVKTNEELKWAMTTSLDLCMQMRAVRFHRNLASLGDQLPPTRFDVPNREQREAMWPEPSPIQQAEMSDKSRDSLVDQLQRWTRIVRPRKDPNDARPAKVETTGKIGGLPDDGCIGLLLANTMRKRFHSSDQYRDYRISPSASIRGPGRTH